MTNDNGVFPVGEVMDLHSLPRAVADTRYRTETVPQTGGLTQEQLDANAHAAYEILSRVPYFLDPGNNPFNSAQSVYVISHAVHNAVKVGIGNGTRIYQHVNRGWLLTHATAPTVISREIEQSVLSRIRKMGVRPGLGREDMPQGGSTETMDRSQISADEVWSLVMEEHKRLSDLLAASLGGGDSEAPQIVDRVDGTLEVYGVAVRLSELLRRAADGEPTVLSRQGHRIAAVVPIELFDAVQDATDEALAREAEGHRGDRDENLVALLTRLMDGELA